MRNITLPVLLPALALIGAGCISFSSGDATTAGDGGIYKSATTGDAWTQAVALPTTDGTVRTIGSVSVATILQDPSDPAAVYVGTLENGMFYSYDGGLSWLQPAQLKRGKIASIAVNPKNKCEVYVTTENKIMRTRDCSRTFEATYLDTRSDRNMTVVMVDFFNPMIVWIANDGGDVLKSEDGGLSWKPVTNFRSSVTRMAFMADDSRRVYAATAKHGVWRTDDSGANWLELQENYREFKNSAAFLDMAIGISDPAVVVIATDHGLLRSDDRGDTWRSLDLLTPESSARIYSVALDPQDANKLYYGTSTTFYRSNNGGVNWTPIELPSSRAATALLVDRANPSVLYMGVTKFEK